MSRCDVEINSFDDYCEHLNFEYNSQSLKPRVNLRRTKDVGRPPAADKPGPKSPELEIFSKRVRQAMSRKGWKPIDLAYHLELKNPVTVTRWKDGVCFPDVPTIAKIAHMIDEPLSWFFTPDQVSDEGPLTQLRRIRGHKAITLANQCGDSQSYDWDAQSRVPRVRKKVA